MDRRSFMAGSLACSLHGWRGGLLGLGGGLRSLRALSAGLAAGLAGSTHAAGSPGVPVPARTANPTRHGGTAGTGRLDPAARERAPASGDGVDERLPTLGDAPDFTLVDQDGRRMSLARLRGKVLALSFIYTACSESCPILTARLAALQAPLGADFGSRLHFVSISLLPEVDTPAVLRGYAQAHRANLQGWSFLTGPAAVVQATVRGYGSHAARRSTGEVDHLTLTSLVDKRGQLRVQYMGTRFRDDEMLSDLRALAQE